MQNQEKIVQKKFIIEDDYLNEKKILQYLKDKSIC